MLRIGKKRLSLEKLCLSFQDFRNNYNQAFFLSFHDLKYDLKYKYVKILIIVQEILFASLCGKEFSLAVVWTYLFLFPRSQTFYHFHCMVL